MCEISIIVPVYNVEKYIRKCVESILNQTYSDFELILVDDGSPDNSGVICDEYAEIDCRVKVIHKSNGGLSDARNAGLNIAKGNFIGFVDSDDFIKNDMYELLYRNIKKENADLSICGIYDVYDGKTPKEKEKRYLKCTRNEATLIILEGNIISVNAYNKLYKRRIFDNIRYPKGRYHEDSYIIIDILNQCDNIVIDTSQKYYYLRRDDSITGEKYTSKQLDFIDAWQKNEKKLSLEDQEIKDAVHQRVCFANFLVLDKILNSGMANQVSETNLIVKFLRKNFFFILNSKTFTIKRKISMILLMININLYKIPSILQQKVILTREKG